MGQRAIVAIKKENAAFVTTVQWAWSTPETYKFAISNIMKENGRFSWTGEMRVPARTPIFFIAGDSADSITYKGEKLMAKTHYKLRQ